MLTIAHDRDFLDRTVQEIVHVDSGQATVYSGNYSGFERQRAEALTRQAAVHKHQQQRIVEIQRFVDRFRAKDSKARQVQSRIKALERMERVAPVHAESPYRFAFTQPKKISNPTLMLDQAALGYGGQAVLRDITLRVYPQRPHRRARRQRCRQDDAAALPGERTVAARRRVHARQAFLRRILRAAPTRVPGSRQDAARATRRGHGQARHDQPTKPWTTWAGGVFRGDDVRRPAATFSGGEKARLVLAMIACQAPAVLVLDEPTNHLDLEMREALALALQQYQGALLVVSHDRHLAAPMRGRFLARRRWRCPSLQG